MSIEVNINGHFVGFAEELTIREESPVDSWGTCRIHAPRRVIDLDMANLQGLRDSFGSRLTRSAYSKHELVLDRVISRLMEKRDALLLGGHDEEASDAVREIESLADVKRELREMVF